MVRSTTFSQPKRWRRPWPSAAGNSPRASARFSASASPTSRKPDHKEQLLRSARRTKMGPLAGIRVVEFAGIGPGPMAAMLLADMGATVVRLDRTGPSDLGVSKPTRFDLLMRGRRSIAIDLKRAAGIDLALQLLERADASIEGFRPGTMERLGLGPEIALARNPRLVYGRMTGWGQEGPLAQAAGHDLNYIALSGALWFAGEAGRPPMAPPTLVGDLGGGALYLAMGVLAGILNARRTGMGQVVDA